MITTDVLPDALREALGQVIANERREWRRERELIEAQSRETVAELRARIVELERTASEAVAARLAEVRSGVDGRDGKDADISGLVVEIEQRDAARLEKFACLEREVSDRVSIRLAELRDGKDGEPGRDGKDAVPAEIAERLIPEVERAVAAIPAPRDGKDADPELVASLVASEVERAVSSLPKPKDGQDGKDADPAEIAALVATAVETAVRGLPSPQDGKDGEPGPPGVGERGPEGPPGKLGIVRTWVEGVHYEGDVVAYRGGTYQALRDTGKAPDAESDWLSIAMPGRDGRSPDIRGTYNPEEEYRHLDFVALNGGTFVALKDDPGPCPGDGWQLLASAGKRGKDGIPGARGERGLPGEPGVSHVGWKVDTRAYAAVPVMSDGSEGAPLVLRDLFEQFLAETR